jgi:hypothetical protein
MLELSSNTIKVIGIFGRLSDEQEAFFDSLEKKYSKKPTGNEYDIFRHLTLSFANDATVSDVREQLELLKSLKQFLPLKLKVNAAFVKDEEFLPGAEHIAINFGLEQTTELVDFVKSKVGFKAVATWYIKVVWFVPKEKQQIVIEELSELKELEFIDFYLVSNKQNDENTIFTTNQFY